jgi:hypothetical protein
LFNLLWCWGWNPGSGAWQQVLYRELHPQPFALFLICDLMLFFKDKPLSVSKV